MCHNDLITGIETADHGFVSCSEDGFLKFWDLRTMKCQQSYYSKGSLQKVVIDKNRIITGGDCVRV